MLAAIAALLLAAAPPCGLPPLAGPPPWASGEQLEMDLGLLGAIRVGEVLFAVERPPERGGPVPVVARVRNTTRFGPVRRLAAVGLSWLDPVTLRPERYREESDEDGRRRTSDARLSPPAAEVVVVSTDRTARGERRYARRGDVLDPLAAIYYLRAARLAPGSGFCFDLLANGKYWRVTGKVAARTAPIEVPWGRFEALRLEATARRADGTGKDRPLWLWLGTDGARLPLAAATEVDLGPVAVRLTGVRSAGAPR